MLWSFWSLMGVEKREGGNMVMEVGMGSTIWFAIEMLSDCVDAGELCDVRFLWRLVCHFVVCKSRNEWFGGVDIITVAVG
jgi:hypothetical protein